MKQMLENKTTFYLILNLNPLFSIWTLIYEFKFEDLKFNFEFEFKKILPWQGLNPYPQIESLALQTTRPQSLHR